MKNIKKQVFITVMAVFTGSMNFAQTTIASANLTTQDQVDAFNTTVTEITGFLNIGGTDINNLDGLDQLEIVGGNINITNNPALTSLSSLGALTSVGGTLAINNNDLLTSLVGLEGVKSTTELNIVSNEKLVSLNGLNNLVRISFLMSINFNPVLTSLEGLDMLTSITQNLTVYSNAMLSTLNGLNNLTALGGKLFIGTLDGSDSSSNPALTNFCAISQLVTGVSAAVTTDRYFVANNEYNPTHAGLASGTVESAAGENDGCAEFGTMLPIPPVVVSTNTFSKEEDGYRLFPNPVKDILFVKSESKITSITISNVSGQVVLKSNSESIHVGGLSKGIYFARIVSGEKTVVEKFVKL